MNIEFSETEEGFRKISENDFTERGFFYDVSGEIYLVHGYGISKIKGNNMVPVESYSFENARKNFPPLKKITKGKLTFNF